MEPFNDRNSKSHYFNNAAHIPEDSASERRVRLVRGHGVKLLKTAVFATAKGLVTKEYFPNIQERLKMKLSPSPNFAAMVTAHGKTKTYLQVNESIANSYMALSRAVT